MLYIYIIRLNATEISEDHLEVTGLRAPVINSSWWFNQHQPKKEW